MLFSVCGKIMNHKYASTMENTLAAGRMGRSAAPHSPLQAAGDRDTRGRIPPLNSTEWYDVSSWAGGWLGEMVR